MLIAILPLVAMSIGPLEAAATPPHVAGIVDESAATLSVRKAQVELADLLASADSVDSVHGRGRTFTFAITRGDHRFALVATTTKAGEVVKLVDRELDPGSALHARGIAASQPGGLSWLVDAMRETTAVTRLHVDEDGAVTLTTTDGMRYMAIPGRGSGGSA